MKIYKNLEILNLKIVAKLSKVGYGKLYFRKVGRIEKEMSLQDRTNFVKAVHKQLNPLFQEMGFTLTVDRMSGQ